MAKKNGKSKGPAKPATVREGGLIPLKKICAKVGIETKPARVKLRRVWRRTDERGKVEGNLAFHKKNARWDLTPKEAREVEAILRG
jgi:hypothetical protein